MKKTLIIVFTLVISIIVLFTACGLFGKEDEAAVNAPQSAAEQEQPAEPGPKYNIAVILPNDYEQKWIRSGVCIMETFGSWGYGAELYYADNDAQKQASLIDAAVSNGIDCIVIAAADSYSNELRWSVENARKSHIPIIAYDRLIMNTEGIDVYVAFDPYLSGRMCGQYIEGMINTGQNPNIEILMGDNKDASLTYFYSGAMDVLMPHINEGRINVPSGLKSFEHTSASAESAQTSREKMETILRNNYTSDVKPNAVLTSGDTIAIGVIEALESAGYSGGFPIVTGAGCYVENMRELAVGKQSASVFKDERVIAERVAEAADMLVHGLIPPDTDRTTFNNGVKIVPAILAEPVLVDTQNYRAVLIGSDYYSYTDIHAD